VSELLVTILKGAVQVNNNNKRGGKICAGNTHQLRQVSLGLPDVRSRTSRPLQKNDVRPQVSMSPSSR
jgi:hypothetical protein